MVQPYDDEIASRGLTYEIEYNIKTMQCYVTHFYYQKLKALTNKISYISWNQDWIMEALTILLAMEYGDENIN